MSPLDESYQTSTGLFTDYTGTVKDAYFATWEKARNPQDHFLFLVMQTDSPDRPEHTEILSLGQGWSSNDGGETVYNDQGGKQFNKKFSQYAKWIDAAVPLIIAANVADEFAARGPTRKASVWKGTKWAIGAQTENYTKKDGTPGQSFTNVPREWLGFVGGSGAGSNGQVEKADLSFVPEELLEKLQGVARAAGTRERFLDRVMLDVPEAQQVDGLMGKLAGQSVYTTLAH